MKFGLAMTGMLQQHAGTDMAISFREAIGLARLAHKLGFDYLYAGQHYLSDPYQMLQPLPVMARLAAEAPGLNLVVTAVLPLHNPIDLAEQIASLDVISDGHAILVAALGYRKEEYLSFGIKREERVSRMVEALTVLKMLWSGDKVSFDGKFFRLSDSHIGIKPVQEGGPPIWVAASSDIAIKRSARLGYPWLIHHADYPTVRRQLDLYNSARQVAGHPRSSVLPIVREFFVAETRKQAYAECGPYLTGKYDTYSQWGQDLALPGEKSFQTTFEELSRDRFVVGSVEDVISDISRYQDLGITHMGLRIRWAGMPLEPAVRCMELVGEHIIPRFAGN